MKRTSLKLASMTAAALCFTGVASAEWSKTYVVEWYEPANYFGADEGGGIIDPGTDCPTGINPEPDWIEVLVKAGYTEQEARWLRDPTHPYRLPSQGQNQMAFRGEGRANIYTQPWLTPDPGLVPVAGTIGMGFDLDGDASNGFTSPDGETTGIDNEFYRSMGCWQTLRGPHRLSGSALSKNDEMREGRWTVAIVVSGEGDDPMNDEKVKVGFYDSTDSLVKDGNGEIAHNYTFRISPDKRFEAIIDARTVNGVIETVEPSEEVWLRDPSYTRELQLLQAQLRMEMKEDGTLTGMIGGYRPWYEFYRGWVDARGSVIESLTYVELPAVWYALRRHADYAADGPGGEKTHISYAMRIDAVPAYVMVPDASQVASTVMSYKDIAPEQYNKIGTFATLDWLTKRTVDGVVLDENGEILAGPDAEIVPPPSASLKPATVGGAQ